jgi:two-component system, NtrC family, sensor kinase
VTSARATKADFLAEIAALRKRLVSVGRESKRREKRVVQLDAALAAANDQQTATGEILRVISSSPTEPQPVLDVVAKNAARMCGAQDASIALVQGNEVPRVAWYSASRGPPRNMT